MASTGTQTLTGSCHCKFIKYTVDLPVDHPKKATRCNCTICLKMGWTGLEVKPEHFKLISPSRMDEMTSYATPRATHAFRRFCPTCGVLVLTDGYYEWEGTKIDLFLVNLGSLDQPQEGLELNEWSIAYWDGRTDGFTKGKQDRPWKGGLV